MHREEEYIKQHSTKRSMACSLPSWASRPSKPLSNNMWQAKGRVRPGQHTASTPGSGTCVDAKEQMISGPTVMNLTSQARPAHGQHTIQRHLRGCKGVRRMQRKMVRYAQGKHRHSEIRSSTLLSSTYMGAKEHMRLSNFKPLQAAALEGRQTKQQRADKHKVGIKGKLITCRNAQEHVWPGMHKGSTGKNEAQ
eukprot:1153098-Pelagomonas_calceolata.AAC.1